MCTRVYSNSKVKTETSSQTIVIPFVEVPEPRRPIVEILRTLDCRTVARAFRIAVWRSLMRCWRVALDRRARVRERRGAA